MLVLSRDCDTVVRIGPEVKVTVLSIRKRRVKLGIDAPKGICVLREELLPKGGDRSSSPKEALPAPARGGAVSALLVEDDPAHALLISETLLECSFSQPTVDRSTADTAVARKEA